MCVPTVGCLVRYSKVGKVTNQMMGWACPPSHRPFFRSSWCRSSIAESKWSMTMHAGKHYIAIRTLNILVHMQRVFTISGDMLWSSNTRPPCCCNKCRFMVTQLEHTGPRKHMPPAASCMTLRRCRTNPCGDKMSLDPVAGRDEMAGVGKNRGTLSQKLNINQQAWFSKSSQKTSSGVRQISWEATSYPLLIKAWDTAPSPQKQSTHSYFGSASFGYT